MRTLITGGAGFIGSNLVDFLLEKREDVIVLDDFSTGLISNLSHNLKKVELIESKIEDTNLFKIKNIGGLIHLAAQPSIPVSIDNFKSSSTTNMLGAINVIDFCSKNNIPLVYASSSAVYGNLDLGNDLSGAVDLLSPYAADKYAMESYARVAHEIYQLSSIGLRFFNVYGPRQDPSSPYSGVISIFVDRLLKKQPITINGGYQTRDFIYVKDVAYCIHQALMLAQEQTVFEKLNILTGRSVSIDELIILLSSEIGIKPEIIHKELPLGDPVQSNGTTKKMCDILKVQVSDFMDTKDGLTKTISYIKQGSYEYQ